MRETNNVSLATTFSNRFFAHCNAVGFLSRSTLRSACVALMVALLAGCANTKGQTDSRTPGNLIDDEAVETLIARQIRKSDPGLKNAHLSVVSFNGIVLLLGQVDSEALKRRATDAATNIRKARTIHNEMEISGPISRVARSNDSWLTSKVKSRLVARRDIRGGRIKVVTENSIVYLMGLVTREHGDKAVAVAQKVFGVQKIVKVFEYID